MQTNKPTQVTLMKTFTGKALIAAVSLAMLGSVGCAATNAASSNNGSSTTKKARPDAAEMIAKKLEAASTPISATQAATIAQRQVSGGKVLNVNYGKGGHGHMRGPHKGKEDKAERTAPTAQAAADKDKADIDKESNYHVMVATGETMHRITVDANTGAVLENETMQKPERQLERPAQANATATQTAARPERVEPAISLTQAMQAAASSVGGEAIGGGMAFGKGMGKGGPHGEHGKRGERPDAAEQRSTTANAQSQTHQAPPANADKAPKTPAYGIQVAKSGELYRVKVDAMTGQVLESEKIDADDMKRPNHDHKGGKKGDKSE